MTDLTAKAIENIVNEQFIKNSDGIQQTLLTGLNDSMTPEVIHATMLINSMKLSVNMSVQIISELLTNSGIVEFADEERLRRLLLSPVNKK